MAQSLNNLAVLYQDLGAYARAEPLYQRALAIHEKVYGPEHPDVALSLNNLALLYEDLGEYARAEPLYQRALAIVEQVYGPEHPHVATTLNNLAALYHELGDYARAEPLYQRALAIVEQGYGLEHPDVATSLDNLAVLYNELGDYARAEPLYQRALAIREQVYGPEHPDVAQSLNSLAGLYEDLGAYARAEPLYQRALAIALGSREPELLYHVQGNFSVLLAQQGQPDAAILFGKLAVNTLQSLRAGMAEMEQTLQQSFLKSKESYYRDLADLLIQQGRLPEAQQVLAMLKEQEYFEFIRRDAEEDVRSTEASYTPFETEQLAHYQNSSRPLIALGGELLELERIKPFARTPEQKARIAELRLLLDQAHRQFIATLEAIKTAFAQLDPMRREELALKQLDVDPRGLVRELHDQGHEVVLIHYVVLEEGLRILLTTPRVQLARQVELPAAELNRQIQTLREALQSPRRNPLPAAQALYLHLIAPIAEDLKQAKARILMVYLDGALRYIPLAALHDGQQYLAERYALAVFTAAARDRLKDLPQPAWYLAGLGLSRELPGFDPLPAVPQELEAIVRRDTTDPDGVLEGVIHLDEAFTPASFRASLADQYPVLHVASHFVFKPGTERDSFLLLGDGSRLDLGELRQGDYPFTAVDLLTLSACETAIGGQQADGQEIEGLGTLAQKKGAKGVIATLWPVADASTGQFMQHFYRLREQGLTKAEALRQAQLLFLQGEEAAQPAKETAQRTVVSLRQDQPEEGYIPDPDAPYAHPYYWAPFILMGNWL